jgi:hypothetical protein
VSPTRKQVVRLVRRLIESIAPNKINGAQSQKSKDSEDEESGAKVIVLFHLRRGLKSRC